GFAIPSPARNLLLICFPNSCVYSRKFAAERFVGLLFPVACGLWPIRATLLNNENVFYTRSCAEAAHPSRYAGTLGRGGQAPRAKSLYCRHGYHPRVDRGRHRNRQKTPAPNQKKAVQKT